jgi:hypothetical protein
MKLHAWGFRISKAAGRLPRRKAAAGPLPRFAREPRASRASAAERGAHFASTPNTINSATTTPIRLSPAISPELTGTT